MHRRGVMTHAAQGDGTSGFDFVKAFKQELGMQSNQLPAELRERVEKAIAALGYRVTVGEVAARAGVKLADADKALKAIAYDSLANLEVSDKGEVVYAFQRDFISRIRNKSWLQRLRPLWKKTVSAAKYLARVAFGTALVVSAVVAWLAVVAITSSRDSDRRNNGYGYGGPRGYVFFDPTDIFLIWDPYYGRHSSFVFGDGDPNLTYEERRWRALGAHIQRLGGVVSAEEMAPFLDPPPLGRSVRRGSEKYEDESFVLPALLKFNGEPLVDDDGRLLYRFPDLQVAASSPSVRLTASESRVPLEREWEFSAASPGQQLGAFALGVVNVVGVVTLSTLLLDPIAKLSLYRQGLGFVLGLLPYLQSYAAAFFALPVLRLLVDGKRNAVINDRNDNRLQAVELLQSGDADLAAKADSARKLGTTRVIGRQDVVYTTEKETSEQFNAQEEADFDSRLGANGNSTGSGRKGLPEGRGNRIDDVFGNRLARLRQRERDAQQIEVEWPGQSQQKQQQQQNKSARSRRDRDWDRLDDW
eukprot:gene3685-3945_t